jgi:prepilin-type N-terminal cleavage/methylation domain-containing protein
MKQKMVGKPLSGLAKAFTLIELLVVIAIIALLIAILLPSLEAARRQAKLNACLSHIKNIATSSRVYEADDPAGWGIPAHAVLGRKKSKGDGEWSWDGLAEKGRYVGAYEWGGKSGIGWQDFTGGGSDPVYSAYGTLAGFGPATRPMNDILYKGGFTNNAPQPELGESGNHNRVGCQRDAELQLDLFKCPGDDGPPRGAHCKDWIDNSERSSFDHFGTSYTANIFMIGRGNSGEIMGNSPYLRPTTRVPTPARTLYYEENIGRWAWSARNELPECHDTVGGPGVDPGPTKAVRGWHGRDWTFNRAFVDAHAETQKIYIEGTEDKDGYAQHYRNEYLNGLPPYPGDPPDTNDNYNLSYQCIIVRGDGWQKDTFPAELIRTGLENTAVGRPSYEKCVTPAGAE